LLALKLAETAVDGFKGRRDPTLQRKKIGVCQGHFIAPTACVAFSKHHV
jgi:hypothetical protein